MCHKSVAHPPFFNEKREITNEKLQMRNEKGGKGGFLGENEVF